MVLKAGDMERCLPKLAWHLEEPRVGQSYPNYYAAQLASKFVKVVLSGAGGDELFGGYPWRYYRAVVNQDFEHYVDKYYLYWQRLIPNRHSRASVRADLERREARLDPRHLPRCLPDSRQRAGSAQRTTSTTRSTSRPRPSCTGCWSSRTSSAWRTAWRTRVPFLDNDLVDFAMRLPGAPQARQPADVLRHQRKRAGRQAATVFPENPRRQSDPARRHGAVHARRSHEGARSRASRRRTRAGSRARASTSCGARC